MILHLLHFKIVTKPFYINLNSIYKFWCWTLNSRLQEDLFTSTHRQLKTLVKIYFHLQSRMSTLIKFQSISLRGHTCKRICLAFNWVLSSIQKYAKILACLPWCSCWPERKKIAFSTTNRLVKRSLSHTCENYST